MISKAKNLRLRAISGWFTGGRAGNSRLRTISGWFSEFRGGVFVPCSASSRQLPLLSHPPRTLSIADADDDEDDLEDKDGFDDW